MVCHQDVQGEHREYDCDHDAYAGGWNANWIANSVSTIPESIRFGTSDESAATAIRVVETVSSTSTVARVSSGRLDGMPRQFGPWEDPERQRPLGHRGGEEDGQPLAGPAIEREHHGHYEFGASVAPGTIDWTRR